MFVKDTLVGFVNIVTGFFITCMIPVRNSLVTLTYGGNLNIFIYGTN